MEVFFIICVTLMIVGSLGSSSSAQTATTRDQSRSYWDRNGSFSGSSIDHGKGSSFYDRDGRFSGSAIRNSDGTTSYFGPDGKFRGSSTNTTQPR